MAAVVLVQHGEKEPAPGDPGLSRRGRAQADRAAAVLAGLGRPAAIYSSPLRRALETGAAIGERFGLDVRHDGRLRERMNWGGEPVQPFDSFLADWERSTRDRDYVPVAGDSSRQAGDRMLAAIGDIADAHSGGTAVVVTHGGVTVDLLRTLLGDDPLAALAPTLLTDGVPPCALTTLGRTGTAWRVGRVASDVMAPVEWIL